MNDVKLSADGQLGVLTHELSSDGKDGITLLDLSDPAHPSVITRYHDDYTGSVQDVHNVWIDGILSIRSGGRWPFVAAGAPVLPGYPFIQVIDVSDLANPTLVATDQVPGGTPADLWLDEANGVLDALRCPPPTAAPWFLRATEDSSGSPTGTPDWSRWTAISDRRQP